MWLVQRQFREVFCVIFTCDMRHMHCSVDLGIVNFMQRYHGMPLRSHSRLDIQTQIRYQESVPRRDQSQRQHPGRASELWDHTRASHPIREGEASKKGLRTRQSPVQFETRWASQERPTWRSFEQAGPLRLLVVKRWIHLFLGAPSRPDIHNLMILAELGSELVMLVIIFVSISKWSHLLCLFPQWTFRLSTFHNVLNVEWTANV